MVGDPGRVGLAETTFEVRRGTRHRKPLAEQVVDNGAWRPALGDPAGR